jgi:hypothetical protein
MSGAVSHAPGKSSKASTIVADLNAFQEEFRALVNEFTELPSEFTAKAHALIAKLAGVQVVENPTPADGSAPAEAPAAQEAPAAPTVESTPISDAVGAHEVPVQGDVQP